MKSIWIWVVVILVILALGYVGRHQIKSMLGGNSYQSAQTQTPAASTSPNPQASSASASASLIMTKSSDKGNYLTDEGGKTLYLYDKDTLGVSNCSGNCAVVWPPYGPSTTAPTTLPDNMATIIRDDGSTQYTYKGMPLYYYQKDTKAGDTLGDGVGGVWHLVKP